MIFQEPMSSLNPLLTVGLQIEENAPRLSAPRTIATGFLLNILNPKLSLFFLAFLPQFVPANAPDVTARMLILGGVFMVLTFLVFAVYVALAAGLRQQVLSRPKIMVWTQRSFAAALGLMGLRLALADR